MLSCYACAMRCPVLRSAMLLHVRCAMSGTEISYAATRLSSTRTQLTGLVNYPIPVPHTA
eukprot:442051-Rhodomonas_salina.2